jgi:ParB family chromosome partitioning protein
VRTACKRRRAWGWEDIEALVFVGNADDARLREIDENLYRHELTPFDQATFLIERRAIFERRNVLTKLDISLRNGKSPRLGLDDFVKETKEKFNLGRSTILKALQRCGSIDRAVWNALREAPLAKSGADLDRLAGLEPDDQREVARLLIGELEAGETRPKTLGEALTTVAGARGTPRQPSTGPSPADRGRPSRGNRRKSGGTH